MTIHTYRDEDLGGLGQKIEFSDESACDVQLTTNIAMKPNISNPDDNQLEDVYPHSAMFPLCPEYSTGVAKDDYRSLLWVEDDDWGGVPSFIGKNGKPGEKIEILDESTCNIQLTTNIAMKPNISNPDNNQLEDVYPHSAMFPLCPEYSTGTAKNDYRSLLWVEDDDWGGVPSFIGKNGKPGQKIEILDESTCNIQLTTNIAMKPNISNPEVGSISSLERDSVGSCKIPLGVAEQLTTASISAPGGDGSSSFRGLQSQRPSLNKDDSWRCSDPMTALVVGAASWHSRDSLPDHAPSCCDQDFSTPDPLDPHHLDPSIPSGPCFQGTRASSLKDRGFRSSSRDNSQCTTQGMWLSSYDENEFKKVRHMSFIDTHCHLDFLFKRLNFLGTLSSFKRANPNLFPASFGGCVAVFCDPISFGKENSWRYLIEDENVWGAFGCHPHMANRFNEVTKRQLERALSHPKVAALGEIGLDYSSNNSCDREVQKRVFRYQIQLALKLDLTIIIHAREAEEDTTIIMKELIPRHWKIHRHCFGEDWPSAQKLLEYFPNLFIGLTALVTFPSAKKTHEVARHIPLNRLVLETDAPYFVPRKLSRTTRVSSPGMAIHVAAQIAALRWSDSLEDVLDATRKNTKYLYGI